MKKNPKSNVGVIMGSDSDLPVMQEAIDVLKDFKILHEVHIVSAHRTPDWMVTYAKNAEKRGLKMVIAGAGGAAHLPGMVASISHLPVIGVPIQSKNSVMGLDSIFSILQMPPGIPVATVALNGGKNAGLLAVQILSLANPILKRHFSKQRCAMQKKVLQSDRRLQGVHDR